MTRPATWAASALGLGGLTVTAFLRYTVVRVTVRGSSMAPAYEDGDRVLVHRGGRTAVGRVVVLERPARDGTWPLPPVGRAASSRAVAARQWIIKRVAAAPGDPTPLDRAPVLRRTAARSVPPGRLVLLGDNPANSYDSRQAGFFPLERVLGTVAGRPSGGRRGAARGDPPCPHDR
ncbi:S26 family signal peptidase [Streptomyces sp. URMC 126]|uniref:S26 family signal peptidase n=1 Tax=Streptomyces sp. URMC 126 TaxID=3423401 RepID=UPI003F1BF237